MIPFVVNLFLALCLLPPPTTARPTTHMLLARQDPIQTGGDLIFGIAFCLALVVALLGSFAWLSTGRTIAQLFQGLGRICSTSIAFAQRLSAFRLSSLIERAAETILDPADANTANRPRRGGPSHPVATVPGGVQGGRPGRFGGTRSGGDPPAYAPST